MRIVVVQNGFDFHQELERIIPLFFEEVDVQFTQVESQVAELPSQPFTIVLTLHEEDELRATGKLFTDRIKEAYVAEHRRTAVIDDEGQRRKVAKQVVSAVLLQLLEDWTGLKQPWGILTGIRPTKLMHRFLQQGKGQEEIEQFMTEELLVQPTKIALLYEIAQRQLQVLPDLYDLKTQGVSLYIGIPFCPTKCAYCTFPAYAIGTKQGQVEEFLQLLHEEIKAIGQWLQRTKLRVTTIYFGGGTPTSITAQQLDEIFQGMAQAFPHFSEVRELTVEAGRPDTITPEKIDVLKKWKVDRISINPQSFHEETLQAIGRHHTVAETIEKYKMAEAMGMNNINMDLILGLPGEGVKHVSHSLDEVGKLLPQSLTIHTLSFKRASTMTKRREAYHVSDRQEITQMMELAVHWTKAHNYQPYYLYRQKNILGNLENVGYALPGFESLYNIIIMEELQTIIGLGCGAVSKLVAPDGSIQRVPNPKEPRAYVEQFSHMLERKLNALAAMYEKDEALPK
ncbi:coproporphyrinogen III oxidase [Rubeoparvulum massiliense]|uniref:coproporphyrinogen III oxidase n=1 Tax=Rubeoparvulum massiliense TaxID=1631346 RepID=UPI00065E485C|nr:coproporphyrinogen III oxidase [Rubeoparvulum massiliense]